MTAAAGRPRGRAAVLRPAWWIASAPGSGRCDGSTCSWRHRRASGDWASYPDPVARRCWSSVLLARGRRCCERPGRPRPAVAGAGRPGWSRPRRLLLLAVEPRSARRPWLPADAGPRGYTGRAWSRSLAERQPGRRDLRPGVRPTRAASTTALGTYVNGHRAPASTPTTRLGGHLLDVQPVEPGRAARQRGTVRRSASTTRAEVPVDKRPGLTTRGARRHGQVDRRVPGAAAGSRRPEAPDARPDRLRRGEPARGRPVPLTQVPAATLPRAQRSARPPRRQRPYLPGASPRLRINPIGNVC